MAITTTPVVVSGSRLLFLSHKLADISKTDAPHSGQQHFEIDFSNGCFPSVVTVGFSPFTEH